MSLYALHLGQIISTVLGLKWARRTTWRLCQNLNPGRNLPKWPRPETAPSAYLYQVTHSLWLLWCLEWLHLGLSLVSKICPADFHHITLDPMQRLQFVIS